MVFGDQRVPLATSQSDGGGDQLWRASQEELGLFHMFRGHLCHRRYHW